MANKFFKIFFIFITAVVILSGIVLFIFSFFQFNFPTGIFSLKIESLIRLRLTSIFIFSAGILLLIYLKKLAGYFAEIYIFFRDSVRKTPKPILFSLIFILVAAAFFRLVFINRPVTNNEALVFLQYIKGSLNAGISQYSIYSQPLNTIIVHIMYSIFGSNIWILRIPSIISGFLLVFLAYISGSIFCNKKTAIIAAGFTAIFPVLINFSIDIMGYNVFILIFILLLILAKNLKNNYSFGKLFCLILLSSTGLYLSPVMIFAILSIIVWFIFSILFNDINQSKKITALRIIGYFVSTIIIYFLSIIDVGFHKIIGENFKFPGTINEIYKIFTRAFQIKLNFAGYFILLLLCFLIFAGLVSFIIFHRNVEKNKIPLFFPVIFFSAIFLFIVKNEIGLNFLLASLPFLLVVSSAGLVYILDFIFRKFRKIETWLIPAISLIILIGFGTAFFTAGFFSYDGNKEIIVDSERITEFLIKELKQGDKVLINPSSEYIFKYYFYRLGVPDSYLLTYLKPEGKLYIITNKNFEKNAMDSLAISGKSYLKSENINKPELIKEYNSANIYLIDNLNFKNEPVLDYRTFAKGEYYYSKLSQDGKDIIIEGEKVFDTYKGCKIPADVKNNKDYLITFEIKKTKDLSMGIHFYFTSKNYNNDQDNRIEFVLEPSQVDWDYEKIERIISFSQLPENDKLFYLRINTKSYGEINIKNLEIYEIDN